MSRNEHNHSNLSRDFSPMTTMMEKSAMISRKNSKRKIPLNAKTLNNLNNILILNKNNRNSSAPESYSRINTSILTTNYINTKESNKSPQPAIKRITNFSLMLKKKSKTNSTNYSNNNPKKTNLMVKNDIKIMPAMFTSSYLYEKLKANKNKSNSKYPSSEKLNKEINSQDIKLHQGPFDLSCCQEKFPKEIKDNIINALNIMKIKYIANVCFILNIGIQNKMFFRKK